jgi:hypothetical protein
MQEQEINQIWTSINIEKITNTVDRDGNPQFELTLRFEWTPANNQWGDRVWVYKEQCPATLNPGKHNVLVERGQVKKDREGVPFSGELDWMFRWKIIQWETSGNIAPPPNTPPPTAAPPTPVAPVPLRPVPNNVQAPLIDENQMRIMRQSTLHYASILNAPLVTSYGNPELMTRRTIQLAAKLLEYVITGEMPVFEGPDALLDTEI